MSKEQLQCQQIQSLIESLVVPVLKEFHMLVDADPRGKEGKIERDIETEY